MPNTNPTFKTQNELFLPNSANEAIKGRIDEFVKNQINVLNFLAPWVIIAVGENIGEANGFTQQEKADIKAHYGEKHEGDPIFFLTGGKTQVYTKYFQGGVELESYSTKTDTATNLIVEGELSFTIFDKTLLNEFPMSYFLNPGNTIYVLAGSSDYIPPGINPPKGVSYEDFIESNVTSKNKTGMAAAIIAAVNENWKLFDGTSSNINLTKYTACKFAVQMPKITIDKTGVLNMTINLVGVASQDLKNCVIEDIKINNKIKKIITADPTSSSYIPVINGSMLDIVSMELYSTLGWLNKPANPNEPTYDEKNKFEIMAARSEFLTYVYPEGKSNILSILEGVKKAADAANAAGNSVVSVIARGITNLVTPKSSGQVADSLGSNNEDPDKDLKSLCNNLDKQIIRFGDFMDVFFKDGGLSKIQKGYEYYEIGHESIYFPPSSNQTQKLFFALSDSIKKDSMQNKIDALKIDISNTITGVASSELTKIDNLLIPLELLYIDENMMIEDVNLPTSEKSKKSLAFDKYLTNVLDKINDMYSNVIELKLRVSRDGTKVIIYEEKLRSDFLKKHLKEFIDQRGENVRDLPTFNLYEGKNTQNAYAGIIIDESIELTPPTQEAIGIIPNAGIGMRLNASANYLGNDIKNKISTSNLLANIFAIGTNNRTFFMDAFANFVRLRLERTKLLSNLPPKTIKDIRKFLTKYKVNAEDEASEVANVINFIYTNWDVLIQGGEILKKSSESLEKSPHTNDFLEFLGNNNLRKSIIQDQAKVPIYLYLANSYMQGSFTIPGINGIWQFNNINVLTGIEYLDNFQSSWGKDVGMNRTNQVTGVKQKFTAADWTTEISFCVSFFPE